MKKLKKAIVFLLAVVFMMPAGKVKAAETINYNAVNGGSTYFEAGDSVTFDEDVEVTFMYYIGGRLSIETEHIGKTPYTIESYTDPLFGEVKKYWIVTSKGYHDFYAKNVVQLESVVSIPVTATLNSSLSGATAVLDKNVLTSPTDSLTVTITPDEAAVFQNPPSVTATVGDCGPVTAGDNGIYTCTITNVTAKTVITVTGQTVAVPGIDIRNVTISGKKNIPLTKQSVSFDLKNRPFSGSVRQMNVTEWLNLPAGLEAIVTEHTDTTLVIEIAGTPTEKCSDTISVTFPAELMSSNQAYTVKTNAGAMFDIKDEDTELPPENPPLDNNSQIPSDPDVPTETPSGTPDPGTAPVTGPVETAPKTGDESAIMVFVYMMVLAALTCTAAMIIRKRRIEN